MSSVPEYSRIGARCDIGMNGLVYFLFSSFDVLRNVEKVFLLSWWLLDWVWLRIGPDRSWAEKGKEKFEDGFVVIFLSLVFPFSFWGVAEEGIFFYWVWDFR